MRWSFRIGSIAGIRVELHVTFLLFVGWIAVTQGLLTGHPGNALASLTLADVETAATDAPSV